MTNAEERVWAYLLNNRQASAEEVSLSCDVSIEEVEGYMDYISSDNWREEVSVPLPKGEKFDSGKPRYDLIPPEIEEAIARVLTFGAQKYAARNWELGMDWGRPYAALRRHMNAWWGGEDADPETGMLHTWHAACCIAFLVAFEARGTGTDDRPKEMNYGPDNSGL